MVKTVTKFTELVGERLVLRPIADTDYTLYASLYGNADILRYIGPTLDEETLEKSFAVALKLSHQESCKRAFLVAELHDKTAAGIIGLTVTKVTKQVNVGAIFRPEFQRHLLAFEALQVLIKFLKSSYVEYSIVAEVDSENRAAIWLASRLGFKFNPLTAVYEFVKG